MRYLSGTKQLTECVASLDVCVKRASSTPKLQIENTWSDVLITTRKLVSEHARTRQRTNRQGTLCFAS